eukprot:1865599-Pyramimonas_sp.AAC.1
MFSGGKLIEKQVLEGHTVRFLVHLARLSCARGNAYLSKKLRYLALAPGPGVEYILVTERRLNGKLRRRQNRAHL